MTEFENGQIQLFMVIQLIVLITFLIIIAYKFVKLAEEDLRREKKDNYKLRVEKEKLEKEHHELRQHIVRIYKEYDIEKDDQVIDDEIITYNPFDDDRDVRF